MAKEEHIFAIDIGATSIKLCEFVYGAEHDGLTLAHFAHREYEEELSEETRIGVISGLLRQMLAEGGFVGKNALLCLSGQLALMRFAKLPPGEYDQKQIRQLAEFEATNNIPFPVDQIIKDYQFIRSSDGESLDLMAVVVKNDIVEQFTTSISDIGCVPTLIDVAPAACYNAAKANGLGNEGCDVILNIGGRVTTVVFVEGEQFYARTIPIAGYFITQQIAREFNIDFTEAEELKRKHGFVALGGAYAEPESETAANVSKIIRNAMARLHGEIVRTINGYVAQQHGTKPSRIFLTGGTSICTYTDTFFSEKMGIPVEYFNPFLCVTLLDSVDKAKLQSVAHLFTECVGLGLRYRSTCPVELSLIPAIIRRQQTFDRKKLLFAASIIALLLLLTFSWMGLNTRLKDYTAHVKELDKIYQPNKQIIDRIDAAMGRSSASLSQINDYKQLILRQGVWPSILNEIYRIKPDNLWITSIEPIIGEIKEIQLDKSSGDDMFGMGGLGMGMGMGMDLPSLDDGMGNGKDDDKDMITIDDKEITGITIKGCSVLPDNSGVHITLGNPFPFPMTVEKTGENLERKGKGDKVRILTRNELIMEAINKAANTPEAKFEAALRNSQLFSSEENYTGITYFVPSNSVQNYTDFAIQVKFVAPTPLHDVKKGTYSAALNPLGINTGGAFGPRGGMGMGMGMGGTGPKPR